MNVLNGNFANVHKRSVNNDVLCIVTKFAIKLLNTEDDSFFLRPIDKLRFISKH